MQTIKQFIKSCFPGLFILGLHFTLSILFSSNSKRVDSFYQNGIFRFFRKGYDQTIGNFDFPFIYILLPLLLLLLTLDLKATAKKGKTKVLAYLFNYFALFFFLFYLFWAYNYYATNLADRMVLNKKQVDKTYLVDTLEDLIPEMSETRATLDTSILYSYRPVDIENLVRKHLAKFLAPYNYYTKSNARVKPVFGGALMRLRTSGIYISHVFEGHFDSSIHRIQWPFTIAHEMAHGYGVTDEKECNFLAYVACSQSANNYVRYSAQMAHWRYLAFALIEEDADLYKKIRADLPNEIVDDLDSINEAISKYPELLPTSRDVIYDQYLKTHGVEEGIKSYDKMIEMIASWKNSQE